MIKRTNIKRICFILVGSVALCMVGAFAVVSNQPIKSENAVRSLEEVIKTRDSWDVAFPKWSGKTLPDFAVTDIDGVRHRLSDYRGRNVLVVFWATWCPACNVEIPHLNKLRREFKQDDLVILAISNESGEKLKEFADSRGINYSIAPLEANVLPEPFGNVESIPTNFFIDTNGNLKLAALGLVSLGDARAILKAEL